MFNFRLGLHRRITRLAKGDLGSARRILSSPVPEVSATSAARLLESPSESDEKDRFSLCLAGDGKTVLSPFPKVEIPPANSIRSLADFVLDGSRQYASVSQTALVDCHARGSLSYGDLYDMRAAFCGGLLKRGLAKGDVVLFFLHNCPEFAVCLYGCLTIGVRVSPCNHAYGAEELASQINRARPKLIVTFHDALGTVKSALERSGLDVEVLVTDLRNAVLISSSDLPPHTSLLYDFLREGHVHGQASLVSSPIQVRASDVAVLPFSSGTTGSPKPIALSHGNLISNITQQVATPDKDIINHHGYHSNGEPDVTIGVMPFFHIYGMVVTLGSVLLHGGKLVTMAKFQPDLFLRCCEAHRVSQLHFVPPLVQFIAHDQRVDQYDLSSVRSIFCGAAPMGKDLAQQASRRLNNAIVRQGYGMTETSPLTHASPLFANKHGSVGVPLPNTEVRVVDISTGELLKANQNGEIRVRGPQVMQGYVQPDESLDPGLDADGFLPTGDIGHYTEDGYFYVVDRLKEIIKVKGFQVAPAELEAVLLQHDEVLDAGVTGVPDERNGEAPVAFVVTAANCKLSKEDIEGFAAKRLARHKHLTGGVHIVDKIPKTMTGKILRRELKKVALALKDDRK